MFNDITNMNTDLFPHSGHISIGNGDKIPIIDKLINYETYQNDKRIYLFLYPALFNCIGEVSTICLKVKYVRDKMIYLH